jgi:hypothetical protein
VPGLLVIMLGMPRIRHQHAWSSTTHLDGCHYYTDYYACRNGCGHAVRVFTERDFGEDPYADVWAEPAVTVVDRDAKGRFISPRTEVHRCARCAELRAGAEPVHVLELAR